MKNICFAILSYRFQISTENDVNRTELSKVPISDVYKLMTTSSKSKDGISIFSQTLFDRKRITY